MEEIDFGQLHRIAILGGTFNPVHVGHLAIARTILASDPAIERLVFMPNHIPEYKDAKAVVAGKMRMEMLRLATEDMPRVTVSDYELKRDGYTYTVDTLTQIKKQYPRLKILFVIGDDSLFQLHTWHAFEKLAGLCRILVVARAEEKETITDYIRSFCNSYAGFEISYVAMPKILVSSSDIRRKITEGVPVTGLIPEKVLRYIEEQNLYK